MLKNVSDILRDFFESFLSKRGNGLLISFPFFWLLLFFLAPFFIILNISFAEIVVGAPPFKSLYQWLDGNILSIRLNINNYVYLFADSIYVVALLNSVKIALISTFLCLLFGYPMAYAICRASPAMRMALLMMVMLPFWTSFLIRVYAWIGMLGKQGVVNNFLMSIGLIHEPLKILNTDFAVCLGIVYSYLPFMILPLYASIVKVDSSLLEAAFDLGCRPFRSFLTVTLPLTLSGIVAGSVLVFIPAVGEFVIPELLGGPDSLMIGRVIWNEFFTNRDWPVASALAISLIVILVVPFMLFQKFRSSRGEA
ncbi:MAG: putrescine ABC transporter permease PotH [Alphaproteobacteria bacterium 43-37]|nr:MAG: putrescine ABC transporter permease PotH [Alphaproteobacteria bacterium 43-37]